MRASHAGRDGGQRSLSASQQFALHAAEVQHTLPRGVHWPGNGIARGCAAICKTAKLALHSILLGSTPLQLTPVSRQYSALAGEEAGFEIREQCEF